MAPETPNLPALIPDRYPQADLFICDIADAVLKDVMQEMEHPFYTLSKKPDTAIKRYEHNGCFVQVTPSVKGHATIYDKDILVYCISQIMAKLRRGEQVSQRVRITSRDFLIFTNRGTGGKDYAALVESIERLRGTMISTNIRTGDEEQIDFFGLIDAAAIRRKFGLDGRLLWCEVKLSDWVFNAIRANEVLTLHRDYFRLRKPLEKRLYELARKHCGQQATWPISFELLLKKSGSQSSLKRFRQAVGEIARSDHLPDYRIEIEGNTVRFVNRSGSPSRSVANGTRLDPETYNAARTAAPGWDVYELEREWRDWMMEPPRDPDRAFLGFCRKVYERRGRP